MGRFVAIFGGQLGLTEILVVAAVGLLLFGSRLPQVGRSLGRSIVQFKKGLRDVEEEIEEATDEPETTSSDVPPELPAPSDDETPPAG